MPVGAPQEKRRTAVSWESRCLLAGSHTSALHATQQPEKTIAFSLRSCLDLLSSFSFSPNASPGSSALTPTPLSPP